MKVLAYLDAGSGSMIISAIVAGFAGLIVVIRMSFRRMFGVLSPKKRRELAEARAAEKTQS